MPDLETKTGTSLLLPSVLLPAARCRSVLGMVVCLALFAAHGGVAQDHDGATFHRLSDVVYGRKDGLALTMEVFSPSEPNGLGVVWVVSSGGSSSRENTLRPSFEARVEPLLRDGYVVFAAIHSSPPILDLGDAIDDIRRAVRFVRYNASDYQVDAELLGIAGSSSGGLIALMVAMRGVEGAPEHADPIERVSSRVHAAGVFFPPTDWLNYGEESQNVTQYFSNRFGTLGPDLRFYDEDETTGSRTLIEDPDIVREKLRNLSPITHTSADAPATILVHGDADVLVPFQQSVRLIEKLEALGVPNRLVIRDGQGHAYSGWESDTTLLAMWFDEYLLRPLRAR